MIQFYSLNKTTCKQVFFDLQCQLGPQRLLSVSDAVIKHSRHALVTTIPAVSVTKHRGTGVCACVCVVEDLQPSLLASPLPF